MFCLMLKRETLAGKQTGIGVYVSYARYLSSQSLISNPKPKLTDQHSLTIDFLTNSCGLSLERAITASMFVAIRNTDKPNSVIRLLTSHGFTKSQLATLVHKCPPILLANSDKNLRPKIEYFESVGIVGPDLPKFLCSNKLILLSSLKNHIMPNFDFLKRFVKTDRNLVIALKQSSRVIGCNLQKQMVPNMDILRAHGVPEQHIAKLVMLQPQSLIIRGDLFEDVVHVVKEVGFDPESYSFVLAVRTMSVMSKAKWENKKKLLIRFGWSEDEFNLAFRKCPIALLSSEKKIMKMMNFYVHKAGLKPSDVVRCPNLLLASLEKRVFPRLSLLNVLLSKELVNKDLDAIWFFNMRKQDFEKRYVACHRDDPQVMQTYHSALRSQSSVGDYTI